ncbi:hypothetical protein GCM10009574_093930 [Streptomyces asiaticus]|uniref:Transposase n=2 Tax=Streptomyces rhizosphaericus TaxID=114699 RepID=A0ABN1RDB5_9ACTN
MLNSWVKSSLQGRRSDRCRVRRRAERDRRAGTLIRRSRMVAVVALAWNAEARAPAARVRLCARAARASHAALA